MLKNMETKKMKGINNNVYKLYNNIIMQMYKK